MHILIISNSKSKWAWQAQFLSHIFEIFGNDPFSKDVPMISLSFFNNCKGDRTKVWISIKKTKLKRAWQAQFSSYTLETLRRNVLFEYLQMILVSIFDIFNTSRTITTFCSNRTYAAPCTYESPGRKVYEARWLLFIIVWCSIKELLCPWLLASKNFPIR